jgi:hypothetical protein
MNTYIWALIAFFLSSATPVTLLLMREVIRRRRSSMLTDLLDCLFKGRETIPTYLVFSFAGLFVLIEPIANLVSTGNAAASRVRPALLLTSRADEAAAKLLAALAVWAWPSWVGILSLCGSFSGPF